jgi:hypothetical protein
MEDIKEEFEEISREQKELIDRVMAINIEKVEKLNDQLAVNKGNYERLNRILKRYNDFLGIEGNKMGIQNASIEKLYKRLCGKIFMKSIKLNRKYNIEKSPQSYYSPTKEHSISFTRAGLAYLPSYRDRLRTVDDFDFTIKYFRKDKLLRDLPLSKRKLALWQKFYDTIILLQSTDIKLEETIELAEPILTVMEKESKKYEKDEYSNIHFKELKDIRIKKIELDISSYRRQLNIYDSNGYSDFKINFSRDKDDIDSNRHIKYLINQLPEIVFDKLETFLKGIEEHIKNNEEVYEKLKEEFGYLLLSEEI